MCSSERYSVRSAWHQYPQDRMIAHVCERQVDAVCGGNDRDRVRLWCSVPAPLRERSVPLLEHRHDSGLRGQIQSAERWIERQDVRIAPDWQHLTELQGL